MDDLPALGTLLQISFLDHCQVEGDDDQPARCQVRGALVAWEPTHLIIEAWTCSNDSASHNQTRFIIIRSTIDKIEILEVK